MWMPVILRGTAGANMDDVTIFRKPFFIIFIILFFFLFDFLILFFFFFFLFLFSFWIFWMSSVPSSRSGIAHLHTQIRSVCMCIYIFKKKIQLTFSKSESFSLAFGNLPYSPTHVLWSSKLKQKGRNPSLISLSLWECHATMSSTLLQTCNCLTPHL